MLGLGQAFMPAQPSHLQTTEYAMVHAAADVSTCIEHWSTEADSHAERLIEMCCLVRVSLDLQGGSHTCRECRYARPRAMASAKKRPSWYQLQRSEVLSGPCSRWNRVFPGLNSETLTTCTLARGLSFEMDCSWTSPLSCDAKADLRRYCTGARSCFWQCTTCSIGCAKPQT